MLTFEFPVADGVVLVIIAVFFFRSFFRGALKEIFSLIALVSGFFASGMYGPAAQSWLEGWTGESGWLPFVGYAGLFIAVWLAINLFGKLVSTLAHKTSLGTWDRLSGGVIGIAKGAFIVSSVIVFLDVYAPSIAPPEDEDERVMPYMRQMGGFIRQTAIWDVEGHIEKIKEAVGADPVQKKSGDNGGSERQ